MKRSFSLEIQQLQLRQSELVPQAYDVQADKIRQRLQRAITDLQSQLSRTESRFRKLKTEGAREIPDIGLETEWAHYYQAWDRLLQKRRDNSAATSGDLLNFHRQIASKLEKQKQQLNKLRDYSAQLREASAARNASKSTHRLRRIQDLKAILTQFQRKMDAESRHNYDGRLDAAQREAHALEQELADCNTQRGNIESAKKELQSSNRNAEAEIQAIQEELVETSGDYSRSMSAVKDENVALRQRISALQSQVRDLRDRKDELELALGFAHQLQDEVSSSQSLVSQLQ
jgi:predicted  nucleic acid-binding Zn-ribbon protein